jgi:pimeloyl-ACP methyl ester carboxylesterase
MNRRRLLVVLSAVVVLSSANACAQAVPMTPPAAKTVSVRSVILPYVEQGQGATVVFVHGAISDHRIWEAQREPVAQRYRFVALTQRYFGTTLWPDSGEKYSLATHADDLAAFIRDLNAGPVHVVGWSYGGTIQLVLAVQHPELVRSLFVFEGGMASFVTDPTDAKALTEDRKDMVTPAAAATKAGDTAGATRIFVDAVNAQPGNFDALPPAARSIIFDNARTLPLHLAAPPPPQISCTQLGQIKAPVAIARGELTRPAFRILADTAARCIPGSRLLIIPKGRHSAPAEIPSAFNEALLSFLKDN